MACRQITFDPTAATFQFGGNEPFTFAEIGSLIGTTLATGKEVVNLGAVRVTVNYLTSMMRFSVKNGWFNDSFDLGVGDHDFDMNEPTPGFSWNAVVELRACIREFRAHARLAATAQHFEEHHWNGLAQAASQRIAEYLSTGRLREGTRQLIEQA